MTLVPRPPKPPPQLSGLLNYRQKEAFYFDPASSFGDITLWKQSIPYQATGGNLQLLLIQAAKKFFSGGFYAGSSRLRDDAAFAGCKRRQ